MRATHAATPALALLVASLVVAGCGAGRARADDGGGAPVAEEADLLLVPAVEEAAVVFDAATCGSDAPLVITDATEAADLTGVRWVKGNLTFGRPTWNSADDWHFVSEDVPAVARDLRCVEGALRVWNVPSTIDLRHVENLVAVGGDLRIGWNAELMSLAGLDGITAVEGDLWIEDNDGLTSLAGLDGITAVGGTLRISGNDGLTSLAGLNNIATVGGDLTVKHNNGLTTLAGLDSLTAIGGVTYIGYNDYLTSLAGIDSITAVAGEPRLKGNEIHVG